MVTDHNSEEYKLWDEETEEAENDIAGLAISFLTVQAIRYGLSGVLPNTEGLEEPQHMHPVSCTVGLCGWSLAFACGTMIIVLVLAKVKPKKEEHGSRENQSGAAEEERKKKEEAHDSFGVRILMVMQNSCSMSFAWCLLYAGKWHLEYMPRVEKLDHDPNSIAQ